MIVSEKPLLVAVSGGVDSVVMLDMLARDGAPLIVAHVNHGMRSDSDEDETFVRSLAKSYGLPFVSTRLELGSAASEDTARTARYAWLMQMQKEYQATSIATAHHQDDVLETIVINLSRGTGWRGLCSLRDSASRHRPLLSMSKAEIVAYALEHNLSWREDSTNESFQYLRNRIRHQVTARLTRQDRARLLELYDAQCLLREQIDTELQELNGVINSDGTIERYPLIMMEENVAREVLRTWLGESLETSRMQELLIFSKMAKIGARWSLDAHRFVSADKRCLIVLSIRD